MGRPRAGAGGLTSSADEISRKLFWRIGFANAVAGVLVLVYFELTSPLRHGVTRLAATLSDLVVFGILVVILFGLSARQARASYRQRLGWLDGGREPTDDEIRLTLLMPWEAAKFLFPYWGVAAVVATVLNVIGHHDASLATRIFIGTLLGGATTCAMSYLLTERALRPVFARALAGVPVDQAVAVGVRRRLVLTWALGSGVPLVAIAAIPPGWGKARQLPIAVPIFFEVAVGLVVGAVLTSVVARSVSEPLDAVRQGLDRVRRGELDVEVPVDDGGEVGLLQSGFNQMVAGLRDRQRLQDLFGRHVGEDVARLAVESGVVLGGEVRDASVLFVDMINSTGLTESHTPTEVVGVLNRFFDAVVSTVAAEGGWVNKFEGDGAMCVFGAPAEQPDSAARALRAARLLHAEVTARGLDAGIGVSCGAVVAGNIGTEDRYEYTVIGRPVNEAARLCEQAKLRPSRVLVSQATLPAAGDEASHWSPAGSLDLRGFAMPTVVYEVAS